MKSIRLDETDYKILKLLQENAKITNSQLAKEIGLSAAPTLERVNKLEQSGIIKGYHASLDMSKIGLGVCTFVTLTLKGHNQATIDKFLKAIDNIPEITECHHITGAGDFIIKVVSADIAAYQKLLLEKITEIDVVDGLQTMVVLSTFKDSKSLPVKR